jgi:hypothetical protein
MQATPPHAPLPPLTGTLSTPHLELDDLRLEGIELELDDSR